MKKEFSTTRALLLVVANAIGTGIFTTTGFALADLQSPLAVFCVWALGAAYSLLGVLCYSRLHQLYPGSGGEYNFLRRGLHPLLGHLAGWVSLFAGFSASIAASSLAFSLYLQRSLGIQIPTVLVSTLLILVIFVSQAYYPHQGLKIHDRLTWAKLAGVVGVIVVAAIFAPWDQTVTVSRESLPGFSSLAHSFLWVAYAYAGWNAVYYIAAELGGGHRSAVKASVGGALLVALLYLALNFVVLFSSDVESLKGVPEVVGQFLENVFGVGASRWLSGLIAFGLLSTTSAFFITGPRVYARMAEDGALPAFLKSEPGSALPLRSYWLQTVIALIILWSSQLDLLMLYVGFLLVLISALSVLSLLKPQHKGGVWKLLALIFCGSTFWLMYKALPPWEKSVPAVAVLLVLSLYSEWSVRRRGKLSKD